MSRYVFLLIFMVFTAIQIYTAIKSIQKKYPIALKETLISYIEFCVFLLIRELFNILVPYSILVLVMTVIVIQSYFGYYLNYFEKYKYFDRYLHAYGSFTFALFSYSIITYVLYPIASPKLYIAIFVASLGIFVSTLYEISEFIHDIKYKPKKQKGLRDTNFDLISNVIGSSVAGIFTFFMM